MAEETQKKPIRGYVSTYLKLPLRPLEQVQQELQSQPTGETPPSKKSKD
jgi:hypothetical protein